MPTLYRNSKLFIKSTKTMKLHTVEVILRNPTLFMSGAPLCETLSVLSLINFSYIQRRFISSSFLYNFFLIFVCSILTYIRKYPMISAPMNDDRSCYVTYEVCSFYVSLYLYRKPRKT